MKPEFRRFIREQLLELKPYQSARQEYINDGKPMILLDANENPFSTICNRYPDPMQTELKSKIAQWKGVRVEQLYLSNGSDEFISQLILACCEPKKEHILIVPPTFGMYQVAARILGVSVKEIPLKEDFQLDVKAILGTANAASKLLFIPTPNNPTANSFNSKDLEKIIQEFPGLVVVDEAYVEFTQQPSFISLLDSYSNLVVCQTFSKAQGMAGARLGMAFAHPELITFLNRLKAPYNLNTLTINAALKRLENQGEIQEQVDFLIRERKRLETAFLNISFILKVFPSDASFILIRVDDSTLRYQQLIDHGIVVRNPSKNIACENTLRITVGLENENNTLINVLQTLDR